MGEIGAANAAMPNRAGRSYLKHRNRVLEKQRDYVAAHKAEHRLRQARRPKKNPQIFSCLLSPEGKNSLENHAQNSSGAAPLRAYCQVEETIPAPTKVARPGALLPILGEIGSSPLRGLTKISIFLRINRVIRGLTVRSHFVELSSPARHSKDPKNES